jgi:hypothetical protein
MYAHIQQNNFLRNKVTLTVESTIYYGFASDKLITTEKTIKKINVIK